MLHSNDVSRVLPIVSLPSSRETDKRQSQHDADHDGERNRHSNVTIANLLKVRLDQFAKPTVEKAEQLRPGHQHNRYLNNIIGLPGSTRQPPPTL